MRDRIRRLGSDTAVYGVSTIVGRFLTFLLTPVYVNFLQKEEFGYVAYLYAFLGFAGVVYAYGMESAYLRFASGREIGDERQNFMVPFLSVAVTGVLLSLLLTIWSDGAAALLGLPDGSGRLVTLAAWILAFDAMTLIPFASLRLERKARRFAAIRVATIVVNVLLAVVFLVPLSMGITGVFLANLAASAANLLLLLPTVAAHLPASWSSTLHAALLRFGLPILPQGLAAMMLQVVDRPILLRLTDPGTVAVYQANYRLGIFMMLVVQMVDFAWRPFYLTHANDPDARPMFARVLTLFVLLMATVLLVVGFTVGDFVRLPLLFGRPFLTEPYLTGLAVVPVVMLGYLFLGCSNVFTAGIHIEKRTHLLPAITLAGAALNVAANLLLIPRMGIMGAAVATLVSYAAMALIALVVVRRFYPVPYEWGRLLRIAVAAGAGWIVFLFRPGTVAASAWGLVALLVYGALLVAFRVFRPGELRGHLPRERGGGTPPPTGPESPAA
jgi:O-antigen/teichoic acid export membrane protein